MTDDMRSVRRPGADAQEVKVCCAAAYQSEWARLLLGNSFHPGGLALTERLGQALGLRTDMCVLDVASSNGASAIHLARTFGCAVVGVDYGGELVRAANASAETEGMAHRAQFLEGDAEHLAFEAGAFDTVICECAFCTFPDKRSAAAEFARVLLPGGKVGLTDLTRRGNVPEDLHSLLAWVACIADAKPLDDYIHYFQGAGLAITLVEEHDDALAGLIRDVRARLMAAELLVKLKRVALPIASFDQARALARASADAVQAGRFGYALLVATK